MKTLITLVAVLCFANCFGQARIQLKISNFKNDRGVCRACLFDNEASFNGEGGKPVQCASFLIRNRAAQTAFENVPTGNYAVFVFHDENNNSKMDKNFLGVPKEGYGASRNKLPFAAAPTFAANSFVVAQNSSSQVGIRLRNL